MDTTLVIIADHNHAEVLELEEQSARLLESLCADQEVQMHHPTCSVLEKTFLKQIHEGATDYLDSHYHKGLMIFTPPKVGKKILRSFPPILKQQAETYS